MTTKYKQYDSIGEPLINFSRIVPPSSEPVSVAEMRDYLRIDHTIEDLVIARLISSAREWVEQYTRRAMLLQTWRLTLPTFMFQRYVLLPAPVISIVSIIYTLPDGTTSTVPASNYKLVDSIEPPMVTVQYSESWPTTRFEPSSVTIEYQCGYGATPNLVPEPLKLGVMQLAATWFEYRESIGTRSTTITTHSLEWHLQPWRLWAYE